MQTQLEPQKLTLSLVEDLKGKGLNQSEIARMYGVTRQYVSWIKRTYGGRLTPREEILRHFPWRVPAPMAQCSPYKRMRDHGEYMATAGDGMSENKLLRLRSFYKRLHGGFVLEFDPSIPPIPGLSTQGGFALRERSPQDGAMSLIRVNEHTTLTAEAERIWCFPPIEP